MRTNNNYFKTLLLGSVMMTATGSAWSVLDENTLDPTYYNVTHLPRIDFTDAAITFRQNSKKGTGSFKATRRDGGFTLIDPDGVETAFSATFKLTATITNTGELVDGLFSFTSNDPMFKRDPIFGDKGAQTIFSGVLTDLGWSESGNLLEFQTGSFAGWACDMGWCTTSERLWFNVQGGSLGFADALNTGDVWKVTVDGTAVIPIPAAVWLFGSGLIGLIGLARRKNT